MKRQFIPINTFQGQQDHPEQISPSDGGLPADARPAVPSAQPQEAVAPRGIDGYAGTGLLSKWKATQMQHNNSLSQQMPPKVAEQATLEHAALHGSITEPTFSTDKAQGFSTRPVAQHQAGIPELPPLSANLQMLQPFSPERLSPTLAPHAQDPQPFGPIAMPGQFQVSRQNGDRAGTPPFVQQPPRRSSRKNPRKKRRFPIWARVIVSVLLVILIFIGTAGYYYYTNFSAPISKITGQTVVRVKGDAPSQGRSPGGSALGGGRMNILLLGSDDDYKTVHINGGVLAQTDIIVTIDPASKSVSMLSIPRDSWVNVPGFGMHKLDQAYLLGGGGRNGAALSMATIHQDFGIYIDHYAWVGLTGFARVIHTVGGVDVDVIHPITDDAYPDDTGVNFKDPYAVKRLYIAPGPQHLTDLQALEYVRSRHADLVGDFGRSVRQQQVLNQLKYKLNNPDIFGKLPELANDLSGYVTTDMQLGEVLTLMNFARSLDQNKINRVTLGPPFSGDAQINTQAGIQDIVQLNCALVRPLIAKMFALGNNARCDTQANSNNGSLVTSTAQPRQGASSPKQQANITDPWQMASQMASVSTMNLTNTSHDFMGIRSLLDLLFLVVFESPDVLQI